MRNIEKGLVTVMVPVYNQALYIEDCLNSILNQTYSKIELIISNDCSTDDSIRIIQNWVKHHSKRFVNCRIINNNVNIGISKNFNLLLREATGRYLKYLAGDDILMQDAIEKEVDYLISNPDVDIVYANAFIIGPNDKYPIDNSKHFRVFFSGPPQYKNGICEALFQNDIIPAPTVMMLSRTVERFGFFREDLTFEDWEYWLRVATGGGTISYYNYPVVGYRELNISGSHFGNGKEEEERYAKHINSELLVLREYSDKIKNNSMDPYWNRTLKTCIDKGYQSLIEMILSTNEVHLDIVSKCMMLLYKCKLYKPCCKIIKPIIHTINMSKGFYR